MSKQKKTLCAIVIVLGVAVLGLAASVFAKYVATLTSGSGEASVAKWAFATDNANGTITCELTKTYDASTLYAGKIAPGTSGKCPIQISNANSEVGVKYTITPKTITNQPTNLKFYKDAAHTEPFSTAEGETITDTLAPKATASTLYVYWQWPYETTNGDTADTTDGTNAETMTITFEITGEQVRPTPAD